jgi:protein Mpv17
MPAKYYYYCTLAILISFHVGYSAAYSSSHVQSKLSWLLTLDQKATNDGGRKYNLHLNHRNKKNSFWYKTTTTTTATPPHSSFSSLSTRLLRVPRGGGEGEMDPSNAIMEDRTLSTNEKQMDDPILLSSSSMSGISNFPIVSSLLAFGTFYASSLQSHPILTKSLTAGIIFALSDGLAQKLEGSRRPTTTTTTSTALSTNWVRLGASALVGFAYFGPAAHFWYEAIFALLPGTSLLSTIVKAALGQVIFGPIFTCIFFASALLQTYGRQFRLQMWFRKIRNDLPGAWAAGLGFWPLVDLISYSVVPPAWIPLFINMCSLVWTVYLSRVANQSA